MVIALPIAGGQLCMHFGHCEKFVFFDVDTAKKIIKDVKMLTPPPHEPGILPPWIRQQGADLVISGGMGSRAKILFQEAGIEVITGAPAIAPESIIEKYLQGNLETGQNTCDH